MTVSDALNKMVDTVDKTREKFGSMSLKTYTETEFTDKNFEPVQSENDAEYIFVSLVLSFEGTVTDDEYDISLMAEIKNGEIEEKILKRNIRDFNNLAEETYQKFLQSENLQSTLHTLCENADKSLDECFKSINKKAKIHKILVALAIALGTVGVALLIIGPFLI